MTAIGEKTVFFALTCSITMDIIVIFADNMKSRFMYCLMTCIEGISFHQFKIPPFDDRYQANATLYFKNTYGNILGIFKLDESFTAPITTTTNLSTYISTTTSSTTNAPISPPYSQRSCFNCNVSSSIVWRYGEDGKPFCNACGLYLRTRGTNRPYENVNGNVHVIRTKHKAKVIQTCIICGTNTTSAWRKYGGDTRCNRCGLFYKSNGYDKSHSFTLGD
ncbi:3583_t:CDS:2 [Funneliformis caledonium]|uniref:3583_t:CDS:1 n=1 Tax=Funneliformis caledonium TaxID=1117310 RepID=A0A9N9H1K2_9GLOM|nr:3583_t:CDS:2 [Funneliformis caledonium]